MKSSTPRILSTTLLSLSMLLILCGCDGDTTPTNSLDILNTIFLGITAAGAIALIKNI